MRQKTVISILALLMMFAFSCVGWRIGRSAESRNLSEPKGGTDSREVPGSGDGTGSNEVSESGGGTERREVSGSGVAAESGETLVSDRALSGSLKSASEDILKAVLQGYSSFYYCADGKARLMDITSVPSLFDADDPFMKIFGFSMVDLKTDGTYRYSDPIGLAETGIAAVAGFSREGYIVEKIVCAAGTDGGWDSFAADGQTVTEEEYMDMVSRQEEKQDAEWYDFSGEETGNRNQKKDNEDA